MAPERFPAGDPAVTTAYSPLGALAEKIERRGRADFPKLYGGLMSPDGGRTLQVQLTSPDPSAEAQLRSLGAPGVIRFGHASHTQAELDRTHADVTAHVDALQQSGIDVVTWFPGIMGDGMEHIGVVSLTPAEESTLDAMFGAGNVVLEDVRPEDVPVPTGRNSDSAPWNAGDNLTSHGYGCTSGAGLRYNGHAWTVTAAHCYVPGWSIWNALAGQDGPLMGTEHSRDVADGGDDTALLDVNPSDLVWTGRIGAPQRAIVSGYATNPPGYTVCNEGAYSGEVCSTVENNSYGCATVGGYTGLSRVRTECNLVYARNEGGGIANQEGDSGGPMIRYLSDGLHITGIVSLGATEVPCQYNKTTCFSKVYYTAMNEIVNTEYAGSSMVTG